MVNGPAEGGNSAAEVDGQVLWTPPARRVEESQLVDFARIATGSFDDYETLHAWSVAEPQAFWAAAWEYLMPSVPSNGPALVPGSSMEAAAWFPEVRCNVAERILTGDSNPAGRPAATGADLLVAVDERGRRRSISRAVAAEVTAEVAAALRAAGVQEGDRVAAWMPNTIETVLVMLGAAAIGAVFTSCSPDFGAAGVIDRFGQVEPKVLVAVDGYTYGGNGIDRRSELGEIIDGLAALEHVVVVGFLDDDPDLSLLDRKGAGSRAKVLHWDDWLDPHRGAVPEFAQLPFDHPWYVLYSSGTTGVPKCIVHRTGGVLLQHLKEHRLQLDVRAGDSVCYFTTCGWMMWNWLVSSPASGATAVLYEGNPFHPGPQRLWELAAAEQLALLGVSAKYLDALVQSGFSPGSDLDLGALRTVASTGSPLSPETSAATMKLLAAGVGPDGLHLASISGGTDLCGCFVCGDPTSPVHAGELQRPALGMAVDIARDDATSAEVGERGELVCRSPFPSMPLGFWGDGPLGTVGERYRSAYFERIDGVWAQGDFATWTSHGGVVIHGRSDTTLNPGGVRIGTAEIYRQVEQVPSVVESLVFGREVDNDVRVVLLVRLADGVALDEELVAEIRRRVRDGCTPRHVPSQVVAVEDLPRTRSGKLAELAVADQVNGRPVRNTTALANPECLEEIELRVVGGG